LWGRLTRALQTLLTTAWSLGALDGATPADAFSVRCDASTMTQNDLDNGRLVAEIMFTAAATIELIRVTLALETDRMLPSSTTLPEAV
jgi:phage tail sheath protein FI